MSIPRNHHPLWPAGALVFLLCAQVFLAVLPGCSTPFIATDNEILLRFPGTERRSDKIAGVLTPKDRRELIEEKGEKGAHAGVDEKEVLVFQLMQEYKRSTDPIIRRAAIDALGKIVAGADIKPALPLLNEALRDESLGVRISAANALGTYAEKAQQTPAVLETRAQAARLLSLRYRELGYSIDAGEKKENDERKDLRLTILRCLSHFPESPELLASLREGLEGEPLDDGALRLSAMNALGKVTKKRYGADYGLWRDYLDYREGKTSEAPKEVSAFADLSIGSMNPLK